MKNQSKSIKRKKNKAKSENQKRFFAPPLVPKNRVNAFPIVLGSDSAKENFKQKLKSFTGFDAPTPMSVNTTPQGKHLSLDSGNNQCGTTPGGSVLIYSPSQHLSVEVVTPGGKNRETISLFLLRREQERQPKVMSAISQFLQSRPKTKCSPIAATATKKTRDSQPKRKTQRAEKTAVGKSARALVVDYFQKQGVIVSSADIEGSNWNLCHLLSYAIAKNAIGADDNAFDTQVFENIFSAPRAFNENMMRIENVLLKILSENAVKEIQCMAIHSEFEDSHILAELTLEIKMLTHDNRTILFSQPFDVTDSRKYTHENSTAYYALLKSIIGAGVSAKKEPNATKISTSITDTRQTLFHKAPNREVTEDVGRSLFPFSPKKSY